MNALECVLLPGLDGGGTLFEAFVHAAPASVPALRIVRYPPEAGWHLDDYVAHARTAIGSPERCVLIAESFSGPIALRLQRNDPRIAGVVLVASFVTCPSRLLQIAPISLIGARLRDALAASALMKAFCLGNEASAFQVGALKEAVRGLAPDVLRARLRMLRDLDERTSLRDVSVPVLSLFARRDRLVDAHAGAALRKQLQHCASAAEVVVDGPHFLLHTRPDACWHAIAGWLHATRLEQPR